MTQHDNTHPRECEVFLEAVEIEDAAELAKYLDEECRDDEHLRSRVAILLKYDRESNDDSDLTPPEPWISDAIQEYRTRALPVKTQRIDRSRRSTTAGPGGWIPPTTAQLNDLLDAYEIEMLIGRGGMGAVYKGQQTSLQRPVAIKTLPPEFGEDEEFAERFRREALAMAKMDHPNIVTIYDFGSVDFEAAPESDSPPGRLFYFVMEFIDGTDLQHLIRSKELTPAAALDLIGQICDALQYAHGEGYIHRDIKPANIFVTKSGMVKVGDFGLAKLAGLSEEDSGNLTIAGHVMGTPHYLAPESLDGDGKVDHRADIFSLGVMFYQMLTGTIPKGAFQPPSKKVAIDVRLDEIVLKAMQAEPDLRYQNVSEVKDDVTVVTSTQTTIEEMKALVPTPEPIQEEASKPPVQKEEPAPRSPKKKFPVFGTLAVLVVLAGAGLGINYVMDHPSQPASDNGDALVTKVEDENDLPILTTTTQFPLPLPTRELPDPATLPSGKIRSIGGEAIAIPSQFADNDDFVSVQNGGIDSAFALRKDGSVLKIEQDRFKENYRTNVSEINRGSSHFSGQWFSPSGQFVFRNHAEPLQITQLRQSGFVDYAKTYSYAQHDIYVLKQDGELFKMNPAGETTVLEPRDCVRIESNNNTIFGLRESGELIQIMGKKTVDLSSLAGIQFCKLDSGDFRMMALDRKGQVWICNNKTGIPQLYSELNEQGPMIDIACSDKVIAARRKDGRWTAISNDSKADKMVDELNRLAPNAVSLSIEFSGAIWVEAAEPSKVASAQPRVSQDEIFPLSIPTRAFPDLEKLPRGKVKVWGTTIDGIPLTVGAQGNVDDFVEVMLLNDTGWAGLTKTGDVLNAFNSGKSNAQYSGQKIASIRRTSYQFKGEWLTEIGEIRERNHANPELHHAFDKFSLRDLSVTDKSVWAGLKDDGSVVFHGSNAPVSLSNGDFVRIEGVDNTTFGIRENGQIECWGAVPTGFEEMKKERFVEMRADGHYFLALTEDGALWQANSSKVHPVQHLPEGTGPVIDMRVGLNVYVARRASDRRWVAWNGHGVTSSKIERLIEKVATLGSNVESLYGNGVMPALVWIESN